MKLLALLAALGALAVAAPSRAQSPLEKGFAQPPRSARPHTWWHWMNGNVSKEGITADLEAMARVGIGGAQIFNVDQGIPLGKAPFFSPEWRAAVTHAASEAKRLGLELCLHNCAGWSSSGGPWIDAAHSMQMLTWSETKVKGGKKLTVTLPEPPKRNDYYNDIKVLAVKLSPAADTFRIPDFRSKAAFDRGGSGLPLGDRWAPANGDAPAGVAVPLKEIEVLDCDPDGKLTWDAPAGDWTLIRMGHTSTGAVCAPAPEAGRGLECDKLSREAMDLHWEKGIAPILKDMGPELAGKVLNNALIDSYEVGSQNWTPLLRREFIERLRYDPVPWLLVATGRVVESAERSERFLWDMRRVIADLFAQNYVGRFKELCHQNGMLCSVEPYGNGPFDNLQVGALADIPMGEFWIGGAAAETIKIAASSAHVTGRSIVGAESFTADDNRGRWQGEPYGIKALGDRIFTLGVNRYIFHRYAHQPWTNLEPGMTMGPWGTHFERTLTWWDQSAAWLQYVARCQFLLQSGRFVADVLTFSGDDAPGDLFRPTLPPGFDYDGCDRTVLMGARVEKGEIVLASGARYKALLLPESPWMTPQTSAKLAQLIRAGATVIGTPPSKSPSLAGYPECDIQVQASMAGLKWTPPSGLAKALGEPDVQLPERAPLVWIHRRDGDTDLYFVSNQRYTNQVATVSFRVKGRAPELWHPEMGTREAAPEWTTAGSRTQVTLRLGPAESVFVVFRKGGAAKHFVQIQRESGSQPAEQKPTLEIVGARYEAVDGAGGADVTEKVKALVASGETEIAATNANFGDPITLHVKRLKVSYLLNGKRQERSVGENETLTLLEAGPDTALPEFELSAGRLLVWQPGSYRLSGDRGSEQRLNAPAAQTLPLTAPWTLTFPPNLGAPESVTLPSLLSWSEHSEPGVRYFSGTATYTTTFSLPESALGKNSAIILDLGRVKHFAAVTLNGQALPMLWKAPYRLEVTNQVRAGNNTLRIEVTNLWVNRLIGDEQLPPEVEWTGPTGPIKSWPQWLLDGKPRPKTDRVAFTTWRFWQKNDPLLESGLLGPAVIRVVPAFGLN